MKIYVYEKCGSCRKALKWLDERGIAYDTVPIREKPPEERLGVPREKRLPLAAKSTELTDFSRRKGEVSQKSQKNKMALQMRNKQVKFWEIVNLFVFNCTYSIQSNYYETSTRLQHH